MAFRSLLFYAVVLASTWYSAQAAGTGLGGGATDGKLLSEHHFYLLQADVLARHNKGDAVAKREAAIGLIANVKADTFVLDSYYADSPSDAGLYAADELNRIRSQASGAPRRVILAYLSIGEAEDYRAYWNLSWDANKNGKVDRGAPSWLLNQDPQWKGNYTVKYWAPEWQALMFGSATSALDRILAQGFDGVYLDIIDGFERFEKGEDNCINPETGQTYRRDMIDFVLRLAAYARSKHPGYLIVPQNGSQLLAQADYLAAISGQGQEDLYYLGNKRQPKSETETTVAFLKKVTAQGKAVLVTDYATAKSKQTDDIARAQTDGFSIFIAPRALNGLGSAGN